MSHFKIICVDSLKWLQKQPDQSVRNFVTGIPDMNELGCLTIEEYLTFFNKVSQLIFEKVKENGYCIFIQTDRRVAGQWIDKSFLLTKKAYENGFKLVWHKIVCQREVGRTDLYRPAYSHCLCYTKTGKPGSAFADVLPVGAKLYDNGTPVTASDAVIQFIRKQIREPAKPTQRPHSEGPPDVVDVFVGKGTIGVSVLNAGLSFLGIDIDPQQCHASQQLLEEV